MFKKFLVLAIATWGLCVPAWADSSAASSASDSASTSVGSLSDSLQHSSNSSSRNGGVAEGDYRLVDVASLAEHPGMLRLHLQPTMQTAGTEGFWLDLPQAAFNDSHLQPGEQVHASQRPYGMEFSNALTRQAFFLALRDDWLQDLRVRAVEL